MFFPLGKTRKFRGNLNVCLESNRCTVLWELWFFRIRSLATSRKFLGFSWAGTEKSLLLIQLTMWPKFCPFLISSYSQSFLIFICSLIYLFNHLFLSVWTHGYLFCVLIYNPILLYLFYCLKFSIFGHWELFFIDFWAPGSLWLAPITVEVYLF